VVYVVILGLLLGFLVLKILPPVIVKYHKKAGKGDYRIE